MLGGCCVGGGGIDGVDVSAAVVNEVVVGVGGAVGGPIGDQLAAATTGVALSSKRCEKCENDLVGGCLCEAYRCEEGRCQKRCGACRIREAVSREAV